MDDIRVPMRSGTMDDIDNEPLSQADGDGTTDTSTQERRTNSREHCILIDYSSLDSDLIDVSVNRLGVSLHLPISLYHLHCYFFVTD